MRASRAKRRPVTVDFGGLPGPTHNHAGLARGNLAATRNAARIAHPRDAALQALTRIRALAARGYPQAVLPPQERPAVGALRALGFAGDDATVLRAAAREAPALLAACASAAAMWVANAATVSASDDTADGRVHFTPANLATQFHRSLEAGATTRILRAIFADARCFTVHDPLPAAVQMGDEGAANHTRLVAADDRGVDLFVYGRRGYGEGPVPRRFPARQTREAAQAIARRHGLDPRRTLYAQQDPAAIDAGVFHNDVIAVGAGRVLFCHEKAWIDGARVLAEVGQRMQGALVPIVVSDADVTLADAVATYLFNSQLLERTAGGMLLVAPAECREHAPVAAYLDRLADGTGPIREVVTFDLRESMRNGGGPACLRLRVPLTDAERAAVTGNVFVDDALATALESWICRCYRDRLAPADLGDPALLDESRRALDELTQILRLPSIYAFQKA
ncbi:MAG: N-succinylarginine dihydrolase [Burkholderiales bacterium]|nr:N-succinylarginine dihydrolase [Burkholderiales bacterium]